MVLEGDGRPAEVQGLPLGLELRGQRLHGQGVARAVVGTAAAAHAVLGEDLDPEGQALVLEGRQRDRLGVEALRGEGELVPRGEVGPDGGVGAHVGALVALHAGVGVPPRHRVGHGPLLQGRGAEGHEAVRRHGAHG